MVNSQEWLDNKYPKKEKIIKLDLENKNLEGELNLSDFVNLEELNCSLNELTNLETGYCEKLTKLNCSYNLLENFNFITNLPNPEKLVSLDISNCGIFLSAEEVSVVLEQFVNLSGKKKIIEEFSFVSDGEKEQSKEISQEKQKTSLNVQEWLGGEYLHPEKVEELDISYESLVGDLDLSEFSSLEKLNCSHNELTGLKLENNISLLYLDCSHNELGGELNLVNNNQLMGLDCSFNKLKLLAINNCPKLELFLCNDNELGNDLNSLLSSLSNDKLVYLNISDNNIQGDLSNFERFTNLEFLWIGSENKKKIKISVFNKFSGSLESLKGMAKLGSLHVANTDINVGYNYLPKKIKEIKYSTKERPKAKLREIEKDLKNYENFLHQQQIKEKEFVRLMKKLEKTKDNYLSKANEKDKVNIQKELGIFLRTTKEIIHSNGNKVASEQKTKSREYLKKKPNFNELNEIEEVQKKIVRLEIEPEKEEFQRMSEVLPKGSK